MRSRKRAVAMAVAVLAFLGAGGWYVFGKTDNATTVHADFSYINGIYPGSSVTVLGVPVGRVTAVNPQGTTVRVSMSLPAEVELPAEVNAYIMSPALISDRSVELGPAYGGTGPKLQPEQVIPADRAHAPITFDSMLTSLTTMTDALGPDQGDLSGCWPAAPTSGGGRASSSTPRSATSARPPASSAPEPRTSTPWSRTSAP